MSPIQLPSRLNELKGIDRMTIGSSIFLIAVGAILRYAVTAHVAGIHLQTAGAILMVVGAIALVLSLLFATFSRSGAPDLP